MDVLCVWELFSSVFAKAFAVEGKREAGQVEDREGRKGVISTNTGSRVYIVVKDSGA